MTEKMQRPRYSSEVCERAIRMVSDHRHEHSSDWAALVSISWKIGCSPQTLHNWVAQSERDQGKRAGPSTEERDRRFAYQAYVERLKIGTELPLL